MFEWLGRFAYRRRRWVLAAAALVIAVAVSWGVGVFGALSGGGFDDPDAEYYRADQALTQAFGRDEADVVALYTSPSATVDDPAFREAVTSTVDALPGAEVTKRATYWSTEADAFVSNDRRSTYAVLTLAGDDEDTRVESFEAIKDQLAAPGLEVKLGGQVPLFQDINEQVAKDIGRAESISMPIVLVLLLIIFGSLAAASLPLAVGALAILGAFTLLHVFTLVTDVSVFAINIITIIGLGLAIDYALFMVSRFREELSRSGSVEDAVVRTTETAGRTIAFSGLTVAISLASLLLFPQVFLRSMGFGGMAAVLVAMISALTVLPALLAVLGHRVNSLSVRRFFRRRTARPAAAEHQGYWYRTARRVMRRPVAYIVVITAALLALGAPFLRVEFGGVDYRVLPEHFESRQVAETLARDFAPNATSPIEIAVVSGGPVDGAGLEGYVDSVTSVQGVTGAQVVGVAGNTVRVVASYSGAPSSVDAKSTVADIRELPAPPGSEALVGGETAALVDLLASLRSTLPWMGLFVTLVTLVLLFLAFGSVLLPVKAVLMNVLSITASFGALVWIFQDGHLSGLLGFTPTGTIEATQPILMLAILFGLSMDYELFLLSRIREQWDRTGDNTAAVASGLQRTGAIITGAALLLVVVIGGFATSEITFIKMIGVGMVIAIIIDATVIRTLLVPATMRVMGRANWWAPRPLREIYERYGFKEHEAVESAPSKPLVKA